MMLDLQKIRNTAAIYEGRCSVQDVFALCDEVDRLRNENETLRMYYKEWCKAMSVEPIQSGLST